MFRTINPLLILSFLFHREREINNLVRRADFNNDEYVQEFGLTISNSMMEVRGRVLPPPRLQYGGRGATMSGQVSILFRLHEHTMIIRFKCEQPTNIQNSPCFLHRTKSV